MKRDCLTWVISDKAQAEHWSPFLLPLPDMKADSDFCCSGPYADDFIGCMIGFEGNLETRATVVIIDAWMQHPNADWIKNPVFDLLRRWRPGEWSEASQPIEVP